MKYKKMKTFVEFLELCESSMRDGRGGRLSPRGPSADSFYRNKQRRDASNKAALSKAGFSRSPKPITGSGARKIKYTETSSSPHHETETSTFANQSDFASSKIGNLGPKGNVPTSKRVSKARAIRRQLGGDRTPRPVHDVSISSRRTDDKPSTMQRGRSFRREVTQGVAHNLERAGAKPGDIRTSRPTSDSRSRMYGRTLAAKTNRGTGLTADRITKP